MNRAKPFECPDRVFWYLVGLIATDGCLSRDGRHISITSDDAPHLFAVREAAGLAASVRPQFKKGQHSCHRIQISSVELYKRLLAIGLTPCKSLTLGSLIVPDEMFHHFFRGVIDGDGCIRRWIHPSNGREQWCLRIVSASRQFIEWLSPAITRLWRVTGRIHAEQRPTNDCFALKYGKLAARVIFAACYSNQSLALKRKQTLASQCIASVVGWSNSKTVPDSDCWKRWTYQRKSYNLEDRDPPLLLERSA